MIFKTNIEKEYFTDELCYIIEILNENIHPNLSIARARIEPGVTTKIHKLIDTVEYYYIIEGKGEVYLGNDFIKEIEVGDVVMIEPMMNQSIKNIGENDLIFICICTPRFENRNYIESTL